MKNILFLIPLALILAVRLFNYLQELKVSKESDEKMNQNRKNEIKKLLENRKVRTNNQIFDEDEFWEIVTEIRIKSKNSYKVFIDLFKDKLLNFDPNKLIEIDNLLINFYQKYLTKEIIGASQIIFKSTDINYTFLLMNYLISKNQVVFKNTCINEELIDKLKIENLVFTTMNDIIGDCYYLSTRELIPKPNIENSSTKYPQKFYEEEDLPNIFPNLWMEYA